MISTAVTLFQTMSPEIPPQPSLAVSSSHLSLGSRKPTLPSPGSTRDVGKAAGWEQHPPASLALHPQELQQPPALPATLKCQSLCLSHLDIPAESGTESAESPRKPPLACSHCSLPWISPHGKGQDGEVLLAPKAGGSLKLISAEAPAQVAARDSLSPARAIFAGQDPKIT